MRDAVSPARRLRAPHGLHRARPSVAHDDWGEQALRRTWRTVGSVCIAIGVVNAFIPLLPTTVFLLMGAWAYGKGDPQMRERLLQHPRFGASLRLWVEQRQISRKGKVAAVAGIMLSAGLAAALAGPRPITWCVVAGLCGLSAWLATRDEPGTPH